MTIRRIELTNIGNHKSLVIEAGAVTVITGANGTGKTNILEALEALFAGGHRPDLIRRGAESGKVVIDLSDGKKAELAITAKTSTLKVTSLDGSIVPKPATYMKSLAAGFAFEPTALIDAKPQDRAKFLLEAMPTQFAKSELDEACRGDSRAPESLDLQEFNAFLAGKEQARTEINRTIRDRQGMRNSMAATLPEDDGTDWRSKAAELEDSLSAARQELAALTTDARDTVDLLRGEIRENLQRAIDEIRAEAERQIEAAREAAKAEEDKLQELASKQLAEQRAPIDQRLQQLAGEYEAAKVRATAQLKAAGVRDQIKRLDEELEAKSKESYRLDTTIERLRELKQRKIESMPVEGVEVKDGKIFVNGLDFDTQVNTAQQYILSFQIAALKLGKLPLMVCDRAESLDDDTFSALCEAIKDAGYQLFVTRVEQGKPLTVEAA